MRREHLELPLAARPRQRQARFTGAVVVLLCRTTGLIAGPMSDRPAKFGHEESFAAACNWTFRRPARFDNGPLGVDQILRSMKTRATDPNVRRPLRSQLLIKLFVRRYNNLIPASHEDVPGGIHSCATLFRRNPFHVF